ncbi:phage antirepressor KilAC domain-containing protein [Bartonella raoultii]|uniref:AntA/AntB antirepressor family protein n=1 Tax=Bartonella raoultii TaxID=1457020 RepID=A0ABS7I8V6_9HYPH|nr:phage antirepressor KilAC domain-containing protein [Bartonella raoultii]MBX4335586.1 antA/AntB antirepressor family protein [Bartonella raoultii]
MSQYLIDINQTEINNELVQTVNARDLHAFLEIKSEFRNWIKNRIKECKFRENIDFVTAVNFYRGAQMKEYYITLDMAKHLSMIERNDKGHEAREYFIECERRAKQVTTPQIDYSSPQAMIGFLNYLQGQIEQKDHVIAELKPKAIALEGLTRSDGLFGIIDAAKILEVRPKDLSDYLRRYGWVYKRVPSGPLLPYQDKIQKGLMDCTTITIQKNDGTEKTVPSTKITSKGLAYLREQIHGNMQ